MKCELWNDSFQNWKRYPIQKAQLIIADIPYNLGDAAYGSNPMWYIGGDNRNGESDKAKSTFFTSDGYFRISEFFMFCSRLMKPEPKDCGKKRKIAPPPSGAKRAGALDAAVENGGVDSQGRLREPSGSDSAGANGADGLDGPGGANGKDAKESAGGANGADGLDGPGGTDGTDAEENAGCANGADAEESTGGAPCMIVFCAYQQQADVIRWAADAGFVKSIPLVFIKNYSPQVLKANMKIVGATEHAIVLYRNRLPKFNNQGRMIFNWMEWQRDGKEIPKIHPTQKPVKLLKQLISIFTDPGDVVIDPCAGSGSTLRAAAELRRNAYGFEIDKDFYREAKEKMLDMGAISQQNIEDIFMAQKRMEQMSLLDAI